MNPSDVFVRQPVLPPVVDEAVVVDDELGRAGRVRLKCVVSGHGRNDDSVPVHGASAGRDVPGRIRRGVQPRRPRQRHGGREIAEARPRRVVPEDAVPGAGHEKRNRDLCVVLMKIDVGALDVEEALLVLAEAIEGFVGVRHPLLAHAPRPLTQHDFIGQRATVRFFGQERATRRVREGDRAGCPVDMNGQRGRRHGGAVCRMRRAKGGWKTALVRRHQARPREKLRVGCIGDPNDVRSAHLNPKGAAGHRDRHAVVRRGSAALPRRQRRGPAPRCARAAPKSAGERKKQNAKKLESARWPVPCRRHRAG